MNTGAVLIPYQSQPARQVLTWLRRYWTLVKSLQTGLLLVTAAAGYISGCCLNLKAGSLLDLIGSLFLAVSGSTVLNMVYDRDIDACMPRTARRPLPVGAVSPAQGWALGGLQVAGGLAWALAIDPRYAAVVLAGVLLDVVLYTLLLKRRTPYSILFGGLAGGMPVLAGRVLATGRIDTVGILLALGVLLWIPTHMLTFSIRYQAEYAQAGIPTFPAVYGVTITRRIIAVSTLLAAAALWVAAESIGISHGLLALLGGAGLVVSGLAGYSLVRPGPRLNFSLYKGASLFMFAAMLLLIAGGF